MLMHQQAPQHNPYQFIVDSGQAKKRPGLNPSSKQSRIFIVLGGVVLLLIIGTIVAMLLSSTGNAGKQEVLKAAQKQTELIRVSEIGIKLAKGSSAKNLANSVNLSLQSDQATLLATLKSAKVKVSAKELALGKNQKTDTILTAAEQSNKFDEVFIQTIQAQLVEYQKTLKAAYNKAESKKVKAELEKQFETAGLLATAKQ